MMFSRQGKSAGADSADANGRKGPRVASILTDDLTLEGHVSGDGELHVDCVIRGDVSVGRLSVGETGRIEGAVTAESADIRGRVVGSVTARQIRLYSTAHIDGDLTHESLTIETGAHFEGRSLSMNRPAAPLQVTAQG